MGAPDLLFDEASHTYRLLGAPVPGVTSILAPLVNFEGIPPHVLDAKRQLGHDVHLACQYLDEDDLDEDFLEPQVVPYVSAYRQFKADTGAIVLLNERRVAEPMLMYAGTLDRVMGIRGAKWLVDLKTCISTPLAVGPQTAAYLRALGDTSVTHRAALRLRPDGTYRLDALIDPNDWAVFMSCLTILRFKEAHRAVD
jgi:hypothetical protein